MGDLRSPIDVNEAYAKMEDIKYIRNLNYCDDHGHTLFVGVEGYGTPKKFQSEKAKKAFKKFINDLYEDLESDFDQVVK